MKYQIGISIFLLSFFISKSGLSIEPGANIPKRSTRVYVIEKSNLAQETSAFDELEKDMLVVRAKNESLDKLKSRYPNISPGKLQRLQELMQKAGK